MHRLAIAVAVAVSTGCLAGPDPYDIKIDWTTENPPDDDIVTARVWYHADVIETHGYNGTARIAGETSSPTLEVCVELGHYGWVDNDTLLCPDCESYELIPVTDRPCQTVAVTETNVAFTL